MNSHLLQIFPLELVVFEYEELRLHIFEPRYKKLIQECSDQNQTFGVPSIIQEKLSGSGAEMKVSKIEKRYEGGEMDIVCNAVARFNILEVFPSGDSNIAASAMVENLPYSINDEKELHLRLYDLLNEFYHLCDIKPPHHFEKGADILTFVHKCGLSLAQEDELATLQSASERQLYLLNHLKKMVQVMGEVQRTKKVVQLNGHFKKISQSF